MGLRPPDSSNKSASGLPGNVDFSKDISNLSGRPEADLREAGGRLIGVVWGGSDGENSLNADVRSKIEVFRYFPQMSIKYYR